ncbi:MAG: hypothetical protein Q9M97_03885 [Candidatus Gracilibacteria bacterium]|nr:hypothetical protein [Candidatus Gracilibacteria bacterium]
MTAAASYNFKQTEGTRITGIGAFIIPGLVSGLLIMGEHNSKKINIGSRGLAQDIAERKLSTKGIKEFIKKDPILKNKIKIDGDKVIILDSDINVNYSKKDVNFDGKAYSPKKGQRLQFDISATSTYDKDKNSIRKYNLNIKSISTGNDKVSSLNSVEIFSYNNEDIISHLEGLEEHFNANTRNKKGAELIMNPSKSLKDRFESLKILARNTGKKLTLNSLIEKAKTNKDKEFIVSRVSQYLRKSNDANISKDAKKIIKMDKVRSSIFSNIELSKMGVDLSEYRNEFYKNSKLITKFKNTNISNGVALDVVSSLIPGKDTRRGLYALKGNIGVMGDKNGNPIKITINKSHQKSIVEALVGKTNSYTVNSLMKGLKKGEIQIYFVKTIGFDDAVVFTGKVAEYLKVPGNSNVTGTGSNGSTIGREEYHTIGGVLGKTWDESPKPEKPPVEETDTDSLEETDTDSLEETDTDSLEETDTDSLEETDTDSLEETDTDSLEETDTDSLEETDTDSLEEETDTPVPPTVPTTSPTTSPTVIPRPTASSDE